MIRAAGAQSTTTDPRKKRNDEGADEPAKLVENEPVEVERETPQEGNQPVEQVEDKDRSSSPAFEE